MSRRHRVHGPAADVLVPRVVGRKYLQRRQDAIGLRRVEQHGRRDPRHDRVPLRAERREPAHQQTHDRTARQHTNMTSISAAAPARSPASDRFEPRSHRHTLPAMCAGRSARPRRRAVSHEGMVGLPPEGGSYGTEGGSYVLEAGRPPACRTRTCGRSEGEFPCRAADPRPCAIAPPRARRDG